MCIFGLGNPTTATRIHIVLTAKTRFANGLYTVANGAMTFRFNVLYSILKSDAYEARRKFRCISYNSPWNTFSFVIL